MFQSFKDKKNLYFLALGLLAPLAYHGLNSAFNHLFILSPLVENKAVLTYVTENPMFLDAIFCALMIALVWPFYRMVQKDNQARGYAKARLSFTMKGLGQSFVIAMGVGGISAIWQMIARTLLTADETLSQSIQSFDATFAASPATTAYFWSFLSVVLFGPIIEEMIFRGLTFSGLDRIWGGLVAALVSGLYFGFWHSNPMQIVYTAVMGIVLGLVYYATKNMWFPMVIHFINNLTSNLPPAFDNDVFYMGMLAVKVISILPMIYLVYRFVKNRKEI